MKTTQADWNAFRTVEGLQRKAGVPSRLLRRLALKEIADNGLDNEAAVTVGEIRGGYFINDLGTGLDPNSVAKMFSISRPLVSTKLIRLPTRGALGNRLRVVAGAVLASNGFLTVETRNVRLELRPERDGSTTVVSRTPCDRPVGTRIEIGFGPELPEDKNALDWAKDARAMARGDTYAGKSSPWWYDVPQFHELLSACGAQPVRALVNTLDGCTGGRAGEIVEAAGLDRMRCVDVSRDQAARLLTAARDAAKVVNPKRLGSVGPEAFPNMAYAIAHDTVSFGASEPKANIPFAVEAWTVKTIGKNIIRIFVNRTPVAAETSLRRYKADIDVFGCGLAHAVATAPKEQSFMVCLNVISPYVPITSDGKEPNLLPFSSPIASAIKKAVGKIGKVARGEKSQKAVVLAHLIEVIDNVSGPDHYLFSERQLLYPMRKIVMDEIRQELTRGNFSDIITDYENEHGEIPLMYREPRGSITHPHTGETITLGTLMVRDYERPAWSFNRLLYIEKEGAQQALKQNKWMERHDCAVMSSKGFSTRAARDLIDKLAEHDEDCEVYCAHDADAAGGMINQTLQEATKTRGARKIKIINIGLEPWEALSLGLEVETILRLRNKDGKVIRRPVADNIKNHNGLDDDGTPNLDAAGNDISGIDWDEWLQTHRVELNAFTTPRLIDFLSAKMVKHGGGKLVPPEDVLVGELAAETDKRLRAEITASILEEAGLEARIAEAKAVLSLPSGASLKRGVLSMFKRNAETSWRAHIEAVAAALRVTKRKRS